MIVSKEIFTLSISMLHIFMTSKHGHFAQFKTAVSIHLLRYENTYYQNPLTEEIISSGYRLKGVQFKSFVSESGGVKPGVSNKL